MILQLQVGLMSWHFLHLEIDGKGKLLTKLYDKRIDFSFRIVNFPFICGFIPSAPVYEVFILQLICYARACRNYADFLHCTRLLTNRLLEQGRVSTRLKSRSFMVVIMNSCIVTVYPSAAWKLLCSTCHSFWWVFLGKQWTLTVTVT